MKWNVVTETRENELSYKRYSRKRKKWYSRKRKKWKVKLSTFVWEIILIIESGYLFLWDPCVEGASSSYSPPQVNPNTTRLSSTGPKTFLFVWKGVLDKLNVWRACAYSLYEVRFTKDRWPYKSKMPKIRKTAANIIFKMPKILKSQDRWLYQSKMPKIRKTADHINWRCRYSERPLTISIRDAENPRWMVIRVNKVRKIVHK